MKSKLPTFSIVLETENLGMAGLGDLIESLESLKQQSISPEKANEVVVVIGSHLKKTTQSRLKTEYPWLKLHQTKVDLEYTQAKVEGARAATGEIIVYADSDVRYEKTWLENLLGVFAKYPEATVSSGETNMRIISSYTMSLALSWMLNKWPRVKHIEPTHYFALNNFAIKRDFMIKHPFPSLRLYRGKITFWRQRLISDGAHFFRTPGALGYHAPPGNAVDWWYRMLIYGADYIATADFQLNTNGSIKQAMNLPGRVGNLALWIGMRTKQLVLRSYLILTQEPSKLKYYLLGLPLAVITIALSTLGGLVAVFNRDLIYQQITARERGHSA